MSPQPAKSAAKGVPLLDISRGNAPLRDEILAAIGRVYDSGQLVLGPEVVELEKEVAELCGTKHAIGCASGSDALLLSLMAFDVGRGDEVIVPSFTFFATASAAWRLGAKPVFVDIDPETYNLCPQQVEQAVTPATKAIIPVHLFGQCADMEPIVELAKKHDLAVIEDAAQAIGAKYHGKPAGSIGDVGCFSFYPTKNLGGLGDGGMLTTSSDELADRLRLLRGHGMRPRYYHQEVGINSRLDSFQATALRIKLRHLTEWSAARCDNAATYSQLFSSSGLDSEVGLPKTSTGFDHVWNQYAIRVPNGGRDRLREHLTANKIGAEIYYPVALHQQDCFSALVENAGNLAETERAAKEILNLPIFPELTSAEQATVVSAIGQFFSEQKAKAA